MKNQLLRGKNQN